MRATNPIFLCGLRDLCAMLFPFAARFSHRTHGVRCGYPYIWLIF
jgi:hypothetical protein